MLNKIKRKEIPRQDRKAPETIEQLIKQYDLDLIWTYINNIIDEVKVNKKGG